MRHCSALGEPLSVFLADFSFRAGSATASGSFFSRRKPMYGITVNISSYRANIKIGIKTIAYVES
jgi:hypothetical protein